MRLNRSWQQLEMSEYETKYFIERKEWRKWLESNFESKDDIWLEYPLKKTGKSKNYI